MACHMLKCLLVINGPRTKETDTKLVSNIVERLSIFQTELGNNSNRIKDEVVFINIMPVDLLQCSPLLEALVDSLMPASSILLGSQISMRDCHARSPDVVWVATVAFVSFGLLPG